MDYSIEETKASEEAVPFLPLQEGLENGAELQMDAGLVAWIQCAGSFCLSMGTWGVGNSFGVFEAYYVETFPNVSPSSISWIGSIQLSVLVALGTVAGPLYDYGYLRSLVLTGCSLSVLGMLLTSFSTQYWQLLLSQGVLVGIGNGCLFIPSFAIIPMYFEKKRALATGISQAGSALGGVIFPLVFRHLEAHIGFGWSVRAIAFIMFTIFIVPVFGLRMRARPSKARRLLDLKAWKEPPFFLTGVGFLMLFLGVDIPPFYIQLYGTKEGILHGRLSRYILPIFNLGSLFGRIIPSYAADKLGVFNVTSASIFTAGVLGFVWIGVHTTFNLIVFAAVFGFASGSISSLSLNLSVALSPNPGLLGVRLGMLLTPVAFGLLLGNPIAGALASTGWIGLQLFTGMVLIGAAVLVILVRVLLYGMDWTKVC